MAPTPAKPLRADAQRNYDALLDAAKTVFAQFGADAPLEVVAQTAGVGQGTLYRHFPTREHLFVAILKERVDFLDATAQQLLDAPDAWLALSEWLGLFERSAVEYSGMSARVGEALTDDDSPVAAACAPMKSSFALLFERAQRQVDIRRDISAVQLLNMISALPKHQPQSQTVSPYLAVVLSGLRL
jgi:AcrR family transcriptional regulator